MAYRLMIPGPVDVDDEVLAEMRSPAMAHYGDAWLRIYTDTVQGLKRLFHTQNDLLLLVGPGSAALEAALGSAIGPDDRILIPSNGFFGNRLREIASALRLDMAALDIPWGEPLDADSIRDLLRADRRIRAVAVVHHETSTGVLNPLREIAEAVKGEGRLLIVDAVSSLGGTPLPVDAWGVDLCVTVSNKCLEAPPGVSPISVSETAWQAVEANAAHSRSWFLNLGTWRWYLREWGSWHPTPTTMPTQVVLALRKSVQRLVAEGDEARFGRHCAAAEAVRQGIRALGLHTFIPDEIASPLITVIAGHEGASADALRRYLLTHHDIQVAGGLEDLAGRIVRVGHMGRATSQEYVEALLHGIREWVRAGCP